MDFPRNGDDADRFLESVQGLISDMSSVQKEAAQVTSTVYLLQDRASVTVNAKGVVTQITLDEGVMSTVPAHRLATELTSAIQSAAQKSTETTRTMWNPLLERQKNLPRASDVLDGLTDTSKLFGVAAEPPLMPPGTETPDEATYVELEETAHVDDQPHYVDVEEPEARRTSFSDRAW